MLHTLKKGVHLLSNNKLKTLANGNFVKRLRTNKQ